MPSTIYLWKRKEKEPPQEPSAIAPLGRPPKLSQAEKYVVGGWVLSRSEEHEKTSIVDIIGFVEDHFSEDVSAATVSRLMKSLHLTSHQASMRPTSYKKPKVLQTLHTFLLNVHYD